MQTTPLRLRLAGFVAIALACVSMAAEPMISIVPSTKTDGGSTQGGGGSIYEAENVKLAKALAWLYPGGLADGGETAALPDGGFDIKMTGYPTRSQESFNALAAKVKVQFNIAVEVVETERDGLTLEIPAEAAAKLKKADSEDDSSIYTSKDGWTLKAVNAPELAKWLSREMNQPVTAAGDLKARFNLEIQNSVFKPEELPKALAKVGVAITPAKVKVKVLKATKAG